MKGDILLNVLVALSKSALKLSSITETGLRVGNKNYGRNFEYVFYKIQEENNEAIEEMVDAIKARRRYVNMRNKLRREGLVQKLTGFGGALPKLTNKGLQLLKKLQKQKELHLERRPYTRIEHHTAIIVSFDVPERLRRKRDWLRDILKNIGFTMVQKSVWIGKNKIPEELLKDFRRYKLLRHIEIFEISKSGTLKKIR